MRRALAIVLCGACACACSGGDGILDVTIALDASVSDATVARLRTLEISVSGLDVKTVTDPLAQPFASNRQERLFVYSPASGAGTLQVIARDATGAPLLSGESAFSVEAGQESPVTVTLTPIGVQPGDLAGLDLAGVDLASHDLAAADLAGVDLASTDLAMVPCPSGVLLCDGFESGTIDPLIWDQGTTTTLGTVAPDMTRAHRGQWSLHLHLNAVASGGTGIATVGELHTFNPPGKTFYIRGWYYFQPAASTAVATLFDASQVGGGSGVSLAIDHDGLSIYDGFNANNYVASTTPKVPLGAWTCLEWEVDTATPNQMHAWLDGTQVTQLDLTESTTNANPIASLDVGLAIYPPNVATGALDVWLDDVIVDSAPIGCAK
jgi:hypothetical protein